MAKSKKDTHTKYTIDGLKVIGEPSKGTSDNVEILIPQDMPYVKVRKALELALLRIR